MEYSAILVLPISLDWLLPMLPVHTTSLGIRPTIMSLFRYINTEWLTPLLTVADPRQRAARAVIQGNEKKDNKKLAALLGVLVYIERSATVSNPV